MKKGFGVYAAQRVLYLTTLVLALLVFLSPAVAARIDCRASLSAIEEQICANPKLSALDDELDRVYQEASRLVRHPLVLEKAQQKWIAAERDVSGDPARIEAAYLARIEELKLAAKVKKHLFAHTPPPPSIFGRYSEKEPVCVSIPDTDRYECDNSSDLESYFDIQPGLGNTVKVRIELIFFKDHTCKIQGEGEWVDGVLRLPRIDRSRCVLQLRFEDGKVIAEDPAGLCRAAFCGVLCGFQDIELPKTAGPAGEMKKTGRTGRAE